MNDRPSGPPLVSPDEAEESDAGAPAGQIDLSALSIAGITRRRAGWAVAGLVAAWIVIIFARQAGEGATVASRAEQIARDNKALATEVASLERELRIIEQPDYIAQQARAYELGSADEIPFTLDPSVPAPARNAPGSAAVRVGAHENQVSPLESWMTLLFGPTN